MYFELGSVAALNSLKARFLIMIFNKPANSRYWRCLILSDIILGAYVPAKNVGES